MKLSNIEKETVINFNEAERTASVYTHNEALKRQLLELCQTHPEQVRQTAANAWGGLTFELPKKWAAGNAAPRPLPGAEGRAGQNESEQAKGRLTVQTARSGMIYPPPGLSILK